MRNDIHLYETSYWVSPIPSTGCSNMSIKQTARIRYKTEDNPPMEGVPLIGYSKKYDCWVALVYRKGDNYYTNMECDVEYKTSPPDEYEYVYP